MISWKEVYLPKRFCMVGTRYFASATNNWYSIWYNNYGRTWSITSLPGLVFRRRREVFILLAMPPTSLGRAALVMWCDWFKLQPQTTNQRDGSFGLPLAYTNQKNRPFGLWFMWFAWNQTCHSTNDRCEALASLKGCFLCFCFTPPIFFHWTTPSQKIKIYFGMVGV